MLDPRAWAFWAVTVLVVASSTRNPLYVTIILLSTAVVGITYAPAQRRKLGFSPLRYALTVVPFTALFNGLTAHVGDTVLLRVPDSVPLVGGPVTLEALLFGATNGLVLTGIFSGFVVFNQITTVHDLIQLIPHAYHETGVVMSIALTFVPQTNRALERIREAQAVRGHRVKGLRDWLPIFVPLLISGLERSMGLAEAMVARGYGSVANRSQPLATQGGLLLGLCGLLGGWLAWLFEPSWRAIGVGAILVGGVIIVAALWRAGRSVRRTRYRARHWSRADTLIALGCAAALSVVLVPLPLVNRGTLGYAPYPRIAVPPFDPLIGLGLLGLAVPAALLGGSGKELPRD